MWRVASLQVLLLMEHCDGGSLHTAISAGLLRRHISGQAMCYSNMVGGGEAGVIAQERWRCCGAASGSQGRGLLHCVVL